MKIQEIISEPLQESLAARAVAKVASWLAKPEVAKAVDALTDLWTKEMRVNKGKPITTTVSDITKAIGKHGQDPSVIKAARANATKIYQSGVRSNNISAVTSAAARGIYATSTGINVLTGVGVPLAAVTVYNQRVTALERKLAANEITPEEFNDARNREMSVMIGTMATALVSWAGIRAVAGSTNWILGGMLKKFFGPIMAGLTATGTAAMAYWLTTDDGRKFVAMFFASEYLQLDISPLVGGKATYLVDTIKSMVPGWEQSGGKVAADARAVARATPGTATQGQSGAPVGTTVKQTPNPDYTPSGYDVTTTPGVGGAPGRTNVQQTGKPFKL